ncbi:HNH endonuclease [Paenibacillus sp. GCM10027627]|uniref:HNH endonuclease n=1 Tax=unclassified Paenibacillus TaxID=185978 RepID=UPI0036318AEA
MLFTYQYINHSMEKMQEFIDYIFYEVWCEAPTITDYSLELYDNKPELKEVVTAFHYSSTQGGDFFNAKVEEIFAIFKTLSPADISQLKLWYQSNNNIENLCKNNLAITPSKYSDINRMNKDLGSALKVFFVRLYSQDLLSLKALADKIGLIDDHYTEFVKINRAGKCPFCGLYDIDSEYVHTREAYDHYLPKSEYPFSSISFKNLAPICNKCNSGNKGSKDPLYDINGNRRKAFYPFNPNLHTMEIDLRLNSADIEKLTPQDVTIKFGPVNIEEELKTWNELFGIEARYKAKCCSADAIYWFNQIIDECGDKSPMEFLSIRLESAQKSPYSDTNFLRKPFLEACAALDMFT